MKASEIGQNSRLTQRRRCLRRRRGARCGHLTRRNERGEERNDEGFCKLLVLSSRKSLNIFLLQASGGLQLPSLLFYTMNLFL